MEDDADLFDSVVQLEQRAYESGYGEAFDCSEGDAEGYKAGLNKGYFTALEAAFYEYAACEGEAAAGGGKSHLLARAVSSIAYANIAEVNLDEKLDEARALYKKSRASRLLGPFDTGSLEASGGEKCGSGDCGCNEEATGNEETASALKFTAEW